MNKVVRVAGYLLLFCSGVCICLFSLTKWASIGFRLETKYGPDMPKDGNLFAVFSTLGLAMCAYAVFGLWLQGTKNVKK